MNGRLETVEITRVHSTIMHTETGYIMALPDGSAAHFNQYGEVTANESSVYEVENLTFQEVMLVAEAAQ